MNQNLQSFAITNAITQAAGPLPLTAVRLTGGPLLRAQQLDAAYLLKLEPDRMMAFYRIRAGLLPKAEGYGGWDGDGKNLTGHIAGHYLSAVCLMYAATGDIRFKERADYLVHEMKEVQDRNGNGYCGALENGEERFAEVSRGDIRSAKFDLNGLWSPWYTLHKTYAGLRDAYRHTHNRTALEVEIGFAAWAEKILSPLDTNEIQLMLDTEFGGMNEVLADLYADTGDTRWLALSDKFVHHTVIDPLAGEQDELAGKHGNTQVPKLFGSLARYVYTGDRQEGQAAKFFWDTVVSHHTFATGGHGTDEYFGPPDILSERVDGRTAESCNVYNMLKMTRALFSLCPENKYAEFLERALFNHVLGSIDPGDGRTCYMVPVGRSVQHEYQDMFNDFTCCVGTGMESHALHADGIYYESGNKLWINIYTPSTAQWEQQGLALVMHTTFPEGEAATFQVTLQESRRLTIALRRPLWAGKGFSVSVNGKPVARLPKPGSYLNLTRTWTSADSVAITLPKQLHIEPVPDNPRRAAVMWGPLALAGDLGGSTNTGDKHDKATLPAVVTDDPTGTNWLHAVPDKPGEYLATATFAGDDTIDQDIALCPFYKLHNRTYEIYWDLYSPEEWKRVSTTFTQSQQSLGDQEATSEDPHE